MSEFYIGLAEILEVEIAGFGPDFELSSGAAGWDSLATISTIALIDELFDCTVSGRALVKCATVADIERLIDNAKSK